MQPLLNTTMRYGTRLYQSFDQMAAKAGLPPTISAPLFFVILITFTYIFLNLIITKCNYFLLPGPPQRQQNSVQHFGIHKATFRSET